METATQTRTHADVVLNEDQTVSITVPSTSLTQAITWVAPAAAKDSDRSNLTGINITYGPAEEHVPHYDPAQQWQRKPASGYALTLAATDRYRLHWSTLVVPTVEELSRGQWDTPSGSLTLPAKELAAVAKTWPKPTRATGGMPHRVRITFTPGQVAGDVRLEVLDPNAEHATASQTIQLDTDRTAFPKYKTLVPVPDNSHSPADVVLNPDFLAGMASAAKALKVSGMAFHLPAATDKDREQVKRACLITLNDPESVVSHSAILMPIKL